MFRKEFGPMVKPIAQNIFYHEGLTIIIFLIFYWFFSPEVLKMGNKVKKSIENWEPSYLEVLISFFF